MNKLACSLVAMLTVFPAVYVFVSAQDEPPAPVGDAFAGVNKPASVSGICGIALAAGVPLDEFKKQMRWDTRYLVTVYAPEDVTWRKPLGTQDIEATGYFRLNLPPGKYLLVPQCAWVAPHAPRQAPPPARVQTVEVEKDKFTVVTVNFGQR